MTAGHRRNNRSWHQSLLKDPRPLIAAPATAADRTVDHLKAPDLALRLKSMVKPGHKTILHQDRHTDRSGLREEGAIGASLTDEARIGQKNGLVRQWARRGTRPIQPADQRYESAYLFGAICPARGVAAGLALPYADTQAMQLHIDEIALHVAKGAHAVLLLDRAGWHTTGALVWPTNITPILLPSRSPELNPV